jgi:tetratricopeptide (TPR) repeat protein
MGDSENALIQYRHALDRNPYDYRAEWESARILLSDNPQEALRLASLALELKPDVADALTIRGRALISLQRPREAIEDLRKAISVNPQDAATHFQLARAYREAGMTREAQNENAIFERMDKEAHAATEQSSTSYSFNTEASLRSGAAFASYQQGRRRNLLACFGDLPWHHQPGPATLLSREECEGYTLERLMLDLNGLEPVPAILVIPHKTSDTRSRIDLYSLAWRHVRSRQRATSDGGPSPTRLRASLRPERGGYAGDR